MTGQILSATDTYMKAMFNKLVAGMAVLGAVAALNSCGIRGSKAKPVTTLKVAQNTRYVAPTIKRVAPRNPSISLPSNISGNSKISWSRGTSNGKYIAMTFDDGPVASNTTRVLNMLKQRNIKATFYVIGRRAKNNPAIMRRMVAEGHEVGNHTWTHGNLKKMSNSQVRSELNRTRDVIIASTGIKPRTMRPPYGALSTRQRKMIFSEFGYPAIFWDVDPEDWKKPGISVIRNRIVSHTKAGSIILLHDLHKSSVDAVPSTLDALLRKGYKFVTVSQLIALSGGQ